MDRKKYIFISVFILGILIIGMYLYSKTETGDHMKYVATFNGTKISLEEYYVYLRTQIINFENIAGTTDIWKTDLNGMPLQEVAKQNALDSIVSVKVVIKQASNFGIYLTEEDIEQALINAEALYKTFTPKEKEKIQFDTVINVIKDGILADKIFEELTSSYDSEEEMFKHISRLWLQDVEVEKNSEVWDSIVINSHRKGVAKGNSFSNLVIV